MENVAVTYMNGVYNIIHKYERFREMNGLHQCISCHKKLTDETHHYYCNKCHRYNALDRFATELNWECARIIQEKSKGLNTSETIGVLLKGD